MGTPDILGTYGTFTLYTDGGYTVPAHLEGGGRILRQGGELNIAGGRIVSMSLKNGHSRLDIHGPEGEEESFAAGFDLYVDRDRGAAEIVIGDGRAVLRRGEWSRWLRVDYDDGSFGVSRLTGIVRFFLKAVEPHLLLYMSPVNLDPADPAMVISVPGDASEELQEALGRYYTQGMPDDTKALEAEVFDYGEFLEQDRLALCERREQLQHELERFDEGLLFFYVHSLDQVCHMLWRTSNSSHPGYRPEFERYSKSIEREYEAMDELLGDAVDVLGEDAHLVVMSDHGFAGYERSFNLNTWLAREGYLSVSSRARREPASILVGGDIEWASSRAYGLGLNALYLNMSGRETDGVVEETSRDNVLEEISRALLEFKDPENGRKVVEEFYCLEHTERSKEFGPDALVGYARGYRASGKSALGQIEEDALQDNMSAWSGDHCIAAHEVPGVIVSDLPIKEGVLHLRDLPVGILGYFDVEPTTEMKGRSFWKD